MWSETMTKNITFNGKHWDLKKKLWFYIAITPCVEKQQQQNTITPTEKKIKPDRADKPGILTAQ